MCRLGKQLVLDGADFDVAHGESVALLGSSGSGKTTLLRLIAGFEMAERGEVLIAGKPASRDGRGLILPHRRGIAMLFHQIRQFLKLVEEYNLTLEDDKS